MTSRVLKNVSPIPLGLRGEPFLFFWPPNLSYDVFFHLQAVSTRPALKRDTLSTLSAIRHCNRQFPPWDEKSINLLFSSPEIRLMLHSFLFLLSSIILGFESRVVYGPHPSNQRLTCNVLFTLFGLDPIISLDLIFPPPPIH